jgi:hypothetical protein
MPRPDWQSHHSQSVCDWQYALPPSQGILAAQTRTYIQAETGLKSICHWARPMSRLGHSRRFDRPLLTSDLPPKTDIVRVGRHVSKVPKDDIVVLLLCMRPGLTLSAARVGEICVDRETSFIGSIVQCSFA